MLSTTTAKKCIRFLIPIFIAILSICVLSKRIPETKLVTSSIESLEKSEKTVERFTIAALSTSVAITFLPDDIGSSIADSLASLDKYFIIILVAIFLEKLILTHGTAAAFTVVIPLACALLIAFFITKKPTLKVLAQKVFVLALAVILVIPCGTKISETVCANYLEYVDEVITETDSKSNTVSEIITSVDEEQSILEKISDAFKSAVSSVNDMISYFKAVIKKCITAIAILIVTTCVIPVLTFAIFIWIVKQLFNVPWNLTPIARNVLAPSKENTEEQE